MKTVRTSIPRKINSWRGAAILYGDLGTSKAYVLGLAFALASYSSFWYILAVSVLTLLIGLNYIKICKFYPNGGGVYASVRNRSKVLAVLGGFFLISDYLVTAALSATSAFHYLGVLNPEIWAISSIAVIGFMNFLGIKRTGNLAIQLAIPMVISVIFLGLLSTPFIPKAVHHLTPISGDFRADWAVFVGIIVALSGIESIANTTGSMKLDPGSTLENPSIVRTATPAIVMVIAEVCIFTSLLGLAMNALPGLEISNGDVNAPGYPNVRDAMLNYMGDVFGSSAFGATFGHYFALVISIVVALLLLSAVNTAMIALNSLLFIMSSDGEMPDQLRKLNRFGVPIYSTFLAFLLPIGILIFVNDISGLAALYAVGFVGAIAVNLGATSTNLTLPFKKWERILMFGTFIIMTLIELTLFIDKSQARLFVITIVGVGLLVRALIKERKENLEISNAALLKSDLPELPKGDEGGVLVAITGTGKTLEYAIDEAKSHQLPLFILFVREQQFVSEIDQKKTSAQDKDALEVFEYMNSYSLKIPMELLYTVTAHSAHSVVEIAKKKKVNKVVIGKKRGKSGFLRFLRGTIINDLSKMMPKNMDLIVVY